MLDIYNPILYKYKLEELHRNYYFLNEPNTGNKQNKMIIHIL